MTFKIEIGTHTDKGKLLLNIFQNNVNEKNSKVGTYELAENEVYVDSCSLLFLGHSARSR